MNGEEAARRAIQALSVPEQGKPAGVTLTPEQAQEIAEALLDAANALTLYALPSTAPTLQRVRRAMWMLSESGSAP